MQQRLQKLLSARGVTSRRKAEEMILAGLVSVNGKAAVLGDSADPDTDSITVAGKPLPAASASVYLMLNKPRGYVTTLADEKGRPNAAQLVQDCGARVYPIGRLDMDSEGLLLFTNDGDFANEFMHPAQEIEKVYEVWVADYSISACNKLAEPVELDGYRIHRPEIQVLHSGANKAKLQITIHEGRNRQIRRMCELAGMRVTRLKRVREGTICLGNLAAGSWRYLTEAEIQKR